MPRCIFSSYDGYARAMEIADCPNDRVCFYVDCWLEGSPLMGKNVLESIPTCGDQEKIFKAHFRNVNAPLPHFVEKFIDDGYMEMYQVMNSLREVNYERVC